MLTSWFATGAGGPRQYLELAGQPDAPLELFYTDSTTQSLYKWFVSLVRRSQPPIIMTNDWAGRRAGGASTAQLAMSDKQFHNRRFPQVITRTNSLNGRKYVDDPTILGWDIMNEPRCPNASLCVLPNGTQVIADWAAVMSAWVRQLDAAHAITIGLDGFYSSGPGELSD